MFNLAKNKSQDAATLRKLRAGEGPQFEQAIARLYGACRKGTLAWLEKHGALHQEAEDVFQEALLALLRKLRSDPDFDGAPDAYLFGAACHIWQKICTKKGREWKMKEAWKYAHSFDIEYVPDIEKPMEAAALVSELLSELSDECRAILLDFYVEKLSLEEISQKHGFKNKDVAKQSKYRCMERLKILAKQKGDHINT